MENVWYLYHSLDDGNMIYEKRFAEGGGIYNLIPAIKRENYPICFCIIRMHDQTKTNCIACIAPWYTNLCVVDTKCQVWECHKNVHQKSSIWWNIIKWNTHKREKAIMMMVINCERILLPDSEINRLLMCACLDRVF